MLASLNYAHGTSAGQPTFDIRTALERLFDDDVAGGTGLIRSWLLKSVEVLDIPEYALVNPDVLDDDNNPVPYVDIVIHEFIAAVMASGRIKPIARDDGLLVRIETPGQAGDVDDDLTTRGYAIALKPVFDPDGGTQIVDDAVTWVTTTNVTFSGHDGERPNKLVLRQAGTYVPTVGATTVGSLLSNGRRISEIFYDGAALSAAPGTALKKNTVLIHDTNIGSVEAGFEDFDDTLSLDYTWYEYVNDGDQHPRRPLPMLGYGLTYYALKTKINNAGIVCDKRHRLDTYPAELKEASSIADGWVRVRPYESLEAAGAPYFDHTKEDSKTVRPSVRYEVSGETRAASYMSVRALEQQSVGEATRSTVDAQQLETAPIAFMVPRRNGARLHYLDDRPDKYSLELKPPFASPSFIERWLNTDRLIVDESSAAAYLSDDNFREDGVDRTMLTTMLGDILEQYHEVAADPKMKPDDMSIRYHPAVKALGIEVTWFNNNASLITEPKVEVLPVSRTTIERNDDGEVVKLSATPVEELTWNITVESPPADGAFSGTGEEDYFQVTPNNRSIRIRVDEGGFACVRLYSLIDEKLFATKADAGTARFHKNLLDSKTQESAPFPGYVAFGPSKRWFECGPTYNNTDYTKLADPYLTIEPPTPVQPGLSKLIFGQLSDGVSPVNADWIEGFSIQRHQWHWVGNPVEFASGSKKTLEDNLLAFTGVGSFRASPVVTASVSIASSDNTWDWFLLPGQTLDQISRTETASGDYSVYTLRPRVRFRRWLKTDSAPMELEKSDKYVLGAGALLPGGVPHRRLEPPVMRWAAPMTESYPAQDQDVGELLPTRGPNGNLLIFDEAIMRTDERSLYAGLGETVEVDLVDARPYTSDHVGVTDLRLSEIGPNPIFESKPAISELDEYGLESSAPFGITFDIGNNPKVAQTAICVFPQSSKGRWFLAKIRTRRVVLPETLIDYLADWPAEPDVSKQNKACYPLRFEGEEKVPRDFCVDFDKDAIPSKIEFGGDSLVLPPTMASKASFKKVSEDKRTATYRVRVTWHKDRWEPGPPKWRAQVDLQQRVGKLLRWQRIDVATPYEQANWDHENADEKREIVVELHCDATHQIRINTLHTSDYSDARWISFIGSFGAESLGRNDQYQLVKGADSKEVVLTLKPQYSSANSPGHLLPTVQSLETSLSKNNDPVFQVLAFYEPEQSILQAKRSQSAGKWVAAYKPLEKDHGDEVVRFTEIQRQSTSAGELPPDSIAYLLSFQRISSLSEDAGERDYLEGLTDDWFSLLDATFPQLDEGRGLNQKEAIVRPVPEVLGPIEWGPKHKRSGRE